MKKMSSLERTIEALELRTPDKVPFHAYESPEHAIRQMGHKVHEMYLEPELVPQAMINSAKLYQNDIIYMRPGNYVKDKYNLEMRDGSLIWKDKKTGEIAGHVLYDRKDFIPLEKSEPLIKSAEDIDKIEIIPYKEILEKPEIKSLQAYIREFKGKRFIFGFACAQSANALDSYLGTENAMIATVCDEGLCRAIMERKYEALKEQILAMKSLGSDGIYTGDACASCSFYSPETYKKLFFEYQKRSIDFVHSLGMKALLHICGRISLILEDMAETGADVIESLDALSSGGDTELSDAKRRVGKKTCLKGNIDAVHVIEPLSSEKIYEACMKALNDAGPDGYILSTEQITRDTPAEHVMAMIQARDDYSARFIGTK